MELEHLHIASIGGYRSNYNIMLYCKRWCIAFATK